MLRAMFVADWVGQEERPPFGTATELDREACAIRGHHNLMPEGSLPAVVRTVRGHCDPDALDAALARLSPDARTFWQA